MATPLYVGVDIGTSGCRAIALDDTGEIAGAAHVPLPPPERSGTRIWQDPAVWRRALFNGLEQLFTGIDRGRVGALAVDGTSGTVLVVDDGGRPFAPALMYNDASCAAQARRIAALAPAESGAHGASSGLAKLLHFQEAVTPPAGWRCLSQADWLAAQLSGRFDVSDENNCLKLGYDPIERRWPTWLRDLGVPEARLPAVVAPGMAMGPVLPRVARQLGLPGTVQIVAGTTDSVAAFVATGAHAPGEAVTSLGSTLVLKIVAERPVFAPRFGIYSHRLGDLWLAGGASNSGGAVLRQLFTPQQIDALTAQLRPDRPSGYDYYPLPAPGERFPFDDASLPPRLTPRPTEDRLFFQAILEGIARIEHLGYARLQELGAPPLRSVCSAGGGAKNTAWTRIRGRMLGVAMLPAAQGEAAYGTALLARKGCAMQDMRSK